MSVTPPLVAIEAALAGAVARLGAPADAELELGRARNPAHGDYSSSVAMKLARNLRRPPAAIAEELAGGLVGLPEATVEPVGGYLNFHLRAEWLHRLVAQVARDEAYGASRQGGAAGEAPLQKERVQVEFVSANPTGPVHIGHGRGAILGDTLCRLLAFTGSEVQREYYVNDQNAQAANFGASVYARLHGQEPPARGYAGSYVADLAEEAASALPGIRSQPFDQAEPRLRRFAIERMVERLQTTMARLRVEYDRWFWESSLWEEGLPQEAIERLRAGGHLTEREGALWFAPAIPGWELEDEDRVVIRSNGEPTYFASDLGYLLSKFERRGFHRVIDVWGADHHGYVPRIRGAMAALGLDPEALVVILNQMVNLKEGKMSKRQGRFVTLDELVDRVGADAVRYFYLLRSPDTMMDFDLDLAVSQSNENPVYYAQYAYARLANVEPTAAEAHRSLPEPADMDLVDKPWELAVARQLAFWPETVETAARRLEPHRLPYYVHDLAESVHAFYHAGNDEAAYRVVVADPALTRARLELCRAARNTLKIALGLMGVTAPQRM